MRKNQIRFRRAWHKVDDLFNAYTKSFGLSADALLILELLSESGESYTQKDLCDKLSLPKQLVNSIITSFWEREFVELKEAADRRSKKIILTDRGKIYADEAQKYIEYADSKAWEGFTDFQIAAFTAAMEKYEENLRNAIRA